MSQLVFNGYSHAENEVGIKIDNTMLEDKFRRVWARVEKWTIVGALKSDGNSGDLNSDMRALEAAYQDGGQNYGNAVFTANGNTHTLNNATSVAGVRCIAFGYMTGPWKMHTEMSNRRAFYAVLQAEYRIGTNAIMAFSEELIQIGDAGPQFVFMPSLIGQPQYQTLQLNTTAKYIQRGVVIGRLALQNPNAPVFPTELIHRELTQLSFKGPGQITKTGSGLQLNEMWSTTWLYHAESSAQLTLPGSQVPAV